jgi:hypothetical protein
MEISITDKRMPPRKVFRSEQANINGRSGGAPGYAGRQSAHDDRTLRLMVDFLAGLFAVWFSLTVLGLIGLNAIPQQGLSLSLRILVSSGLALMVCIISSPLFIPWFVVFVVAYLLIPRKSILLNWWLSTIEGSLFGILALWTDALVWSLLTPGPSISLNLPLLIAASIPAAVLGGTICLAAALTENAATPKNEQSLREAQV